MTDDIVTRLREAHSTFRVVVGVNQHIVFSSLHSEAADEIERLRADRDRWFKLADGMAGCLDSSTEAGDLLADYEQAVRGE